MGRTNPSAANNTAAFSQLQAENDALKKENRDLRQKLERMNELLLNAQRARFGSSSEKQDYVMPNQVGIFNEAEAEQDPKAPEPTEETILVPAHTRKPKRTMDELAAGLPVKEILITLPEDASAEKGVSHLDIVDAKGYNVVPVQADMVPTQLANSDAGTLAVINGNYALDFGLKTDEAIYKEDVLDEAK